MNFWAWTSSSGSMLARSAALSCFDRVLFRGYLPVTGDAIWPEILATPTWHPATGIPTRKLLIKRGDTWEPKTEISGPILGPFTLLPKWEHASVGPYKPNARDCQEHLAGLLGEVSPCRGIPQGMVFRGEQSQLANHG